jgi:hypothetical protein
MMRARVAHDGEHHEALVGEVHDEQLELLNLWAQCEEVKSARALGEDAGLA